jgi:hypothetical protein
MMVIAGKGIVFCAAYLIGAKQLDHSFLLAVRFLFHGQYLHYREPFMLNKALYSLSPCTPEIEANALCEANESST